MPLFLLSYFKVACTHPGKVPKDFSETPFNEELLQFDALKDPHETNANHV
jgi:hypothetical protein